VKCLVTALTARLTRQRPCQHPARAATCRLSGRATAARSASHAVRTGPVHYDSASHPPSHLRLSAHVDRSSSSALTGRSLRSAHSEPQVFMASFHSPCCGPAHSTTVQQRTVVIKKRHGGVSCALKRRIAMCCHVTCHTVPCVGFVCHARRRAPCPVRLGSCSMQVVSE